MQAKRIMQKIKLFEWKLLENFMENKEKRNYQILRFKETGEDPRASIA